jgi:hypothetical protein
MNKYGTLILSYANKNEHTPGSLVVQLNAEVMRKVQVRRDPEETAEETALRADAQAAPRAGRARAV